MKKLTDENIEPAETSTTGQSEKEKPVQNNSSDKGTDKSKSTDVGEPIKKDNTLTIVLFILFTLAVAIYMYYENKKKS